MTEKQCLNLGADAYRTGESIEQNPFDFNSESSEYLWWIEGYRKEQEYWESL